MTVFRVKNGEMNLFEYTFSGDLAVAKEAIELFIANNNVQIFNEPAGTFLEINGTRHHFKSPTLYLFPNTYGQFFRVAKLEENKLAEYVQGQKEAALKLAQQQQQQQQQKAQEPEQTQQLEQTHPAAQPAQQPAAQPAPQPAPQPHSTKQLEALSKIRDICAALEDKFDDIQDLTAEENASAEKFIDDLANALENLEEDSNGEFADRVSAFKQTIKPLFEQTAKAFDLSTGDYILNALMRILNALTFVISFGQAPNTWFFEPKVAPHLPMITKAQEELDAEITAASPAA